MTLLPHPTPPQKYAKKLQNHTTRPSTHRRPTTYGCLRFLTPLMPKAHKSSRKGATWWHSSSQYASGPPPAAQWSRSRSRRRLVCPEAATQFSQWAAACRMSPTYRDAQTPKNQSTEQKLRRVTALRGLQ